MECSRHFFCVQNKVCGKICILSILIVYGQCISAFFRVLKVQGISRYGSGQAFYRINSGIIFRQSFQFNRSVSGCYGSVFYGQFICKFYRYINICRDFKDSFAGVVSNLVNGLSHHSYIMCRRGRAVVNFFGKSGAPCQFGYSPDIFQMTHTVIITFFGADNNAIYRIFSGFNRIGQSIQV